MFNITLKEINYKLLYRFFNFIEWGCGLVTTRISLLWFNLWNTKRLLKILKLLHFIFY